VGIRTEAVALPASTRFKSSNRCDLTWRPTQRLPAQA